MCGFAVRSLFEWIRCCHNWGWMVGPRERSSQTYAEQNDAELPGLDQEVEKHASIETDHEGKTTAEETGEGYRGHGVQGIIQRVIDLRGMD